MVTEAHRFGTPAGARDRARCCVWATLALLLFAGWVEAGEVTVALEDSAHTCNVHGTFFEPISRDVAWAVLTDYDHIAEFVTSMASSRAERGGDGSLKVHQVANGSVAFIRRRVHVVLDTREDPGRMIAFTDVLGKDFTSYVGEWIILPDSGGVHVIYRLACEPRGTLAKAFCRGVMRRTARELLEQVRAEMLRRETSAQSPRRGPKGC